MKFIWGTTLHAYNIIVKMVQEDSFAVISFAKFFNLQCSCHLIFLSHLLKHAMV